MNTVSMRVLVALSPILCTISGGCVLNSTYSRKVAELEENQRQRDKEFGEREAGLKATISEREASLSALTKRLDGVDASLKSAIAEREMLRKQLDDNTALVGELKSRLEKLGQNVDKLTSERGQLSVALDESKTRLEELRKQKIAAEAMAATFRDLVHRLRSMIDAGQLKVVVRDGRMLIAMPNDILFGSGKVDIKKDAQIALINVAQVLSTIENRRFTVAGHTDDVPIHNAQFASNWELSAGRAIEVTKFLIAHGMKPQVLAAAGYGEFDPVASNDRQEKRALNRRIEIVLQPNLSELPSIEGLAPAK